MLCRQSVSCTTLWIKVTERPFRIEKGCLRGSISSCFPLKGELVETLSLSGKREKEQPSWLAGLSILSRRLTAVPGPSQKWQKMLWQSLPGTSSLSVSPSSMWFTGCTTSRYTFIESSPYIQLSVHLHIFSIYFCKTNCIPKILLKFRYYLSPNNAVWW